MKKILWFSNCIQSNRNNKASGSWLYSMAQLLTSRADIHLVNVAVGRGMNLTSIQHNVLGENFEEYLLPQWKLTSKGLPSEENSAAIKALCEACKPSLIHVWGVENYFCNLIPAFGLKTPLLLEIQGLHRPCADVYYGDLSFREIMKCFGLREILFPFMKSLFAEKKQMVEAAQRDDEAIPKYQYISTQSQWVRDYLRNTTHAKIFQTGMSLRKEFMEAGRREYPHELNFYCSAAGPAPYKSMQTVFKAFALVQKTYPEARLYVIGNFKNSNWIHQAGYLTYLYKTLDKLGVRDRVSFTGPLAAAEIVEVMRKCIAMVHSSYVESYSLAVAEAQAVGVPSVISYAGAMPELAVHGETGLFYSPGDYRSCAARMMDLIEDKELAEHISEASYELAHNRNDSLRVLECQLKIYDEIIVGK